MRSSSTVVIVGGMALLAAMGGQAEAAGYYLAPVGSRCSGRAGACVAGADALSAAAYNPAALIRAEHSQFLLDVAGVDQRVRFTRQAEPENDLTFDTVRSSGPPMVIPHLSYVHPVWDNLAVGVGFTSPYAPMLSYPADGAQRFTLVESSILSGEVGPTVAWSPIPGLSLGASVAWTFLTLDQTLVSHVNPQGFAATDDPDYDIPTRLTVTDFGAITGDVGVLYDREGMWAAGASLSLPSVFQARGPMSTDLSQNIYATPDNSITPGESVIINDSAEDPETSLALTLPMVLRLGVLVRPSADWEIELDGVWERWSSLSALTLTDIDMEIETSFEEPSRVTDDVVLPLSMKDALSVRLGAERRLEGGRLRGGLYYETSAAADGYASVLLPEGPKIGYGLGSSVRVSRGLWLDLGWTQGVVLPQEITSSQVFQVQIDPLSGAVSRGKVVGRGDLSVLNSAAVLGLRWTPGVKSGAG